MGSSPLLNGKQGVSRHLRQQLRNWSGCTGRIGALPVGQTEVHSSKGLPVVHSGTAQNGGYMMSGQLMEPWVKVELNGLPLRSVNLFSLLEP